MTWSRECSSCGVAMPRAALRCGDCRLAHDRERLRAWRLANPEKRRAQEKRARTVAYAHHREQIIRRVVEWQQTNRDQFNARSRRWRAANPEKHAASTHRVRQANPERVRESTRRYQARRLTSTVERVDYGAIAERDGWICHLCGQPVNPAIRGRVRAARSFDHVNPLSKGGAHVATNIRLAHLGCNSRKGNRSC